MSSRRGIFADISWFQLAVSVLAAVTSAWVASSLGVAGTLIGAALGSFVVTISTAFYGRTLDKGKTLIVQTASGTTIERDVRDGEISAAFDEVTEVDHSPVARAEIVEGSKRRLHWKTITATTVIVLITALLAMGAYEKITDRAFGADPQNPRIGNPFGGSSRSSDDDPEPTPTPTPTAKPSSTPTAATPTPSAPAATPTPAPAPTTTAPAPTAEPAPTATPTPAATPAVPAE